MKIRLNNQVLPAKITTDNPEHRWEIRVTKPDGAFLSFFDRQHLEEAGLQIVQCTSGEWEHFERAGFQPPYTKD